MRFFDDKRPAAPRVKMIATGLIDSNPAQPRRSFDRQSIEELAQSIKENGLLSPVSVRRSGKRYQLIAGERRLMAFRLLGEERIPAIIEEADDRRSAVLAIVENLQRSGLTFFEEAAAIDTLIKSCHMTQRQAAERLGLSQPAVANKLRVLKLPEPVLRLMAEAGLSERHARALLPLAEDERLKAAAERVIKERLSVAQTERLAEMMTAQKKPARRGERLLIIKDLRIFNSAIDRAVDVMKQAGIDAVANKTEDEQSIVYTVVIPKKKGADSSRTRYQTPAEAGALIYTDGPKLIDAKGSG